MTRAELMEKRARIVENARSKYDEITKDTPEARAKEIETEFDRMMTEASDLEARAERVGKLEAAERSLESGDSRRPGGDDGEQRGADRPEPMEYRDAFHAMLAAQGNVHAMAPEAREALEAAVTGLSQEQRAQIASTSAAGGYLVPDEMMQGIVSSMLDWGPMYDDDFATVLSTTGGGDIPIPTNDDTGNTAEKSGPEGEGLKDRGAKDTTFGQKKLGDHMIDTEWLRISVQLATGSFMGIQTFLEQKLGERLGRKANALLTVGAGGDEPLGVMTAAGVGATAAGSAAIVGDDLMNMVHAVNSAYRRSPKAKAMFNDGTLLALSKLKDGDGRYLLGTAPDGSGILRVGPKAIKYAINDDMPDIAPGAEPMIYGDFSRYYVRKIGGVIVGALTDKDFWPGFGLAGYTRLDGTLTDLAAVKKFKMAAA